MFLLIFYIAECYVLPCFDSAKVFPISQSIGWDGGGFSLLSAQFGLFGPLQGQKFPRWLGTICAPSWFDSALKDLTRLLAIISLLNIYMVF
jgi:hypothetical protein